jgi:nitroreductase/NAD-dependent dihydropyrimidine dehydrogenase PreA subunit
MSLIQIDTEKCKRDGICAAVCPAGLIKLEGEAFPEETADAEERCISCGHCVAACPEGALSNTWITGCLPIIQDIKGNAEALTQFLKMRRSIREFKPVPVPREALARAIDTARWAPSAINLQPVRWLVVVKPEKTRGLVGLIAEWIRVSQVSYLERFVHAWEQGRDLILRNAPHVIVAHASPDNIWSPIDSAIAVTYLELAAQADGLGTCWSGILVRAAGYDKRITEYLGLPSDNKVFGAVMIGYPKFRYHRIPEKNPTEIVWL